MIIGVFAGSFGSYGRTTISFLYFFGLFNCYIYLLAFGFFPSIRELDIGFTAQLEEASPENIQIIARNNEEDGLTPESAAAVLGQTR